VRSSIVIIIVIVWMIELSERTGGVEIASDDVAVQSGCVGVFGAHSRVGPQMAVEDPFHLKPQVAGFFLRFS